MKSRKVPDLNSPQIQKIKEKCEKELLLFPNVSGVGIGHKITQGIQADTPCIKVYVSKKIPAQKLSRNQIIPTQLDGILTDVEEIGNVKAYA